MHMLLYAWGCLGWLGCYGGDEMNRYKRKYYEIKKENERLTKENNRLTTFILEMQKVAERYFYEGENNV